MNAPVILFVYKRPEHTKRVLDSLVKNIGSGHSTLIVYSDGAKRERDEPQVAAVRELARTYHKQFAKLEVIERKENFGLAKSIATGVSAAMSEFGRAIILEDDLKPAPYFLSYMNAALERYKDNLKVSSIGAYSFPTKTAYPPFYFTDRCHCWGWATWKRGWDLFEQDSSKLLSKLIDRGLTRKFDYNGSYPYTRMLKDQSEGRIDSWAICWLAVTFLAGQYTLYPGQSLIENIGNDGTGTHQKDTLMFDTPEFNEALSLSELPEPKLDQQSINSIADFLWSTRVETSSKVWIYDQISRFLPLPRY